MSNIVRNLPKSVESDCQPVCVDAPDGQARAIEGAIRRLLSASGADLNDPNLIDTPRRAAEAYAYELLSGYRTNLSELFKTFEEASDEAVLVHRIPFFSLCAHHVLPFFGTASVVYKPRGKVLGLSKIGRVVDCYARRLQIQERLTRQVAEAIQCHLNPSATIVMMRAEHMCMSMRGIRQPGSETITCVQRGASQAAILECRRLMEIVSGEIAASENGSSYGAANHA